MRYFLSFITCALLILEALSQPLSFEDALATALENNYDVRIANYAYEVDRNNAESGNAGLLPSVFLLANGNYSNQNTEVTFANPEQPTISQNGAATISYGASANVEYLLFSGGRRIHVLQQLQSLSEDGRLRLKLAMENTSLNVSARFLESIRLSEEVATLEETVRLSQDRLNRSKGLYDYGNSTKLDVLNAEVDLRRDSIELAQTKLSYDQSLRNLFVAMGLPADTVITLDKDYEINAFLNKSELIDKALATNTAYLRARNDLYNAEEFLGAAKSDIWPTLAANAAYQYQYSDFEANFLNTQENLGLSAGLTFRFNIFDGSRIQRNIANAALNREIAEVEMERSRNEVIRLVNNAYDTYITNLELLNISRRNLVLAETNFERSKEAFATGQITGIELRNAQLNLNDAQTAIIRQKALTKIAEIGLLYEAGILLE